MSLRDDSIIRDERGRIVKGSPGLHRKQEQPIQDQPDNPPACSFDDDLIAAANSYGRQRSKIGRRAYCEWLRDTRPVEFAALLRPALARLDEATITGSGGPGVTVIFNTAPSGMHVDENGKLVEKAGAREEWSRRSGMELSDADSPPASPTKPVLVHPRRPANEITFGGSDDDDDDEPGAA